MASSGAILSLFLVASMSALSLAQTDARFMGGATSIEGLMSGITQRTGAPKLPYPFKYDSVGSGAGISGLLTGKYLIASGDNAYTSAQEIAATSAFQSGVGPFGGRGGKFTLPFVVLTFSLFVSSPKITASNKVDGPALPPNSIAQVFTDQAATWNQVKTSTGRPVTAGAVPVRYVVRCDSSGSTKVFQSYMKLYSSVWSAAGYGAVNVWPGLPVCASQPAIGNKYKTYGSGAKGSWAMVNAVGSCKTIGCITYAQSGFGKGKGFTASAGEKPWILSECKTPNVAKTYINTRTCNVLQVVPRPYPKADATWFSADGKLISATGAQTCPIVAFNYIFARYNYGAGITPANIARKAFIKPNLNFLFKDAQDVSYLSTKAVVKMPSDILTQNVAAVAKILA